VEAHSDVAGHNRLAVQLGMTADSVTAVGGALRHTEAISRILRHLGKKKPVIIQSKWERGVIGRIGGQAFVHMSHYRRIVIAAAPRPQRLFSPQVRDEPQSLDSIWSRPLKLLMRSFWALARFV